MLQAAPRDSGEPTRLEPGTAAAPTSSYSFGRRYAAAVVLLGWGADVEAAGAG